MRPPNKIKIECTSEKAIVDVLDQDGNKLANATLNMKERGVMEADLIEQFNECGMPDHFSRNIDDALGFSLMELCMELGSI